MKRVHLFATAAIVVALPALPAQAQQAVGVTSAVKNDVRLRKPNMPLARPVQLKQRIAIADQVQTGAKSQMQILLLDRSIFTVGANTRLTIDRYVYDPQRNSRTMGATVGRGAFRFMSGRRTGGNTTINTPTAAIGVRGTLVDGVVGEDAVLIANGERGVGRGVRADPETASLIVLRGPGRGTRANVLPGVIDVTSGGRTVTLDQPMLAVYVPYPGAAPIGPFVLSDRGLQLMQALLYPSVAQRLGLEGPIDPNRTYAPAPEFGDGPAPRRLPRRPGMPGGYSDGLGDGPSGAEVPLPLDNLRDTPQPRRDSPGQGSAAGSTPAPLPKAADSLPPPNANANPPAPPPAPSPTPTPAPGQYPSGQNGPNQPPSDKPPGKTPG